MTEAERSQRASRAGKALHSDPGVTQRVVARACRGTRRKFAALVDPERTLSSMERGRLVAAAQKGYMAALSGLGVKARRRRKLLQQAQQFSVLTSVPLN